MQVVYFDCKSKPTHNPGGPFGESAWAEPRISEYQHGLTETSSTPETCKSAFNQTPLFQKKKKKIWCLEILKENNFGSEILKTLIIILLIFKAIKENWLLGRRN